MMEKNAKIYVAGHRGMVGSAIVRELKRQGYENIITRTHKELDLCRQDAVEAFFAEEKPEYVFLAAAKVGGIVANQEALADFMYDNMTLEMNVIHSAWKNGCKKLEFLGSSCIYPRMAPQPMKESCLLTSELEKTNEAYALAKISGLKYCEFLNRQYGTDYISVMPTNLYGPNDNYHPTHSHVLPALIRRFHEAKVNNLPEVTCWGDGSPLREFLYVDDLANLCVFLMNNYSGNETVNAGTGKELTIKELYTLDETIAKDIFEGATYPWEVLPRIKDFILELGRSLPEDEYDKVGEDVWIAKSAVVFESAYIHGPAIIGKNAEVRHCAFIRGNAIVGEGAVVGNSTELKNVILFNKVQVPHYNYVGDSILGYKAHMGAGSITSNVKSDKKLVVVKTPEGNIETGLKKFGAMLGDEVEVGCGTVLNPGSVVGSHSNIYPLSSVRGFVPAGSIYKKQGEVVKKR